MAYVITKACLGSLCRSCVEVCPVDCISHVNKRELNERYSTGPSERDEYGMMMINPQCCINCGACQGECPTKAIFEDSDVPEDLQEFIQLNADETAALKTEKKS